MKYNFKYFDNPSKNAVFIKDEQCQVCGSTFNCLDGEYFDLDEEVSSVCLKCLQKGLIKVNIPSFVENRVLGVEKELKINELQTTPPVPWIQYNDWPACCNDFTKYYGEWSKEDFERVSLDGEGLNFLLEIIEPSVKAQIENHEVFWREVGHTTAVFVFRCLHCSKCKAVPQSY